MSILIKWERELINGIINSDADILCYNPFLLKNSQAYYISSAQCPECKRMLMYKMRVRGVNSSFRNNPVTLFNIFTCPECRRFYASVGMGSQMAKPLVEYALVSKKYLDENEYIRELINSLPYANG